MSRLPISETSAFEARMPLVLARPKKLSDTPNNSSSEAICSIPVELAELSTTVKVSLPGFSPDA